MHLTQGVVTEIECFTNDMYFLSGMKQQKYTGIGKQLYTSISLRPPKN